MAVITFLSDFGEKDHYVAAVKARIIARNPIQPIVDISHQIARHDIGHAAYVLGNVFTSFPEGSVHLVCVDPVLSEEEKLIALELDGQFMLGHDSGVFSLISQNLPSSVFQLRSEEKMPALSLADAAVQIALGKSLAEVGFEVSEYQRRTGRQLKVTRREIVGQVVHVDHYGNLITNIHEAEFRKISELNGGSPSYSIRFGREVVDRFHASYAQVDNGDCFVLFNSLGVVEIGINKGRADQLLGLRIDTQVTIAFNA